ncbi:MAG: PilW family protein [Actinomycetota bacterium]
MKRQDGMTLIETLVALFLFAIITTTLYSLVFTGVRASDTTRDVARVSEEARLGFDRMVRDARESDEITEATPTLFTVKVDFNGDGDTVDPDETESFVFDAGTGRVTLNGELLMEGVQQVADKDVFSYSSNQLEFDSNGDGVATWQEVDDSPNLVGGNENGTLDDGEFPYLTNVSIAIRVRVVDHTTNFFGEAQLRNARF